MSLSSLTVPISAAASMNLQQHATAYRNDYTPRYQPLPFVQPYPHQQYNAFDSYNTCSTSPTTSRGRSGSGDTASYITTSTVSLPTPPQEEAYLSGVSSHYQIQSSQQLCPSSLSPTEQYTARKIVVQNNGEAIAKAPSPAVSPSFLSTEGSPSVDNDKKLTKSAKDSMYCPHPDCKNEDGVAQKRFSRKADVSRHYNSQHNPQHIDCPRPRCIRKGKQGFTRRDHLVEHLRGFHLEAIPKREISVKVQPNDDYEDHPHLQHATEDAYRADSSNLADPKHEKTFSIKEQFFAMGEVLNGRVPSLVQESPYSQIYSKKSKVAARRQTRRDQFYPYPKVEDVINSSQSNKRTPPRQGHGKPGTVITSHEHLHQPVKQEDHSGFNGAHDFSSQPYTSNTSPFQSQYSPMAA
ncbi:hypothetical protein LTR84_011497 [Exophiala bonariae]|uniref:C2H2-type domain-containing protein n=1 Tax=Exophiala bonariae TaxID=1690606 RepID=A0AAV9NH80_9EURO|nr:hypothetical protein LTR84_011497 [Exophiala bonariae]